MKSWRERSPFCVVRGRREYLKVLNAVQAGDSFAAQRNYVVYLVLNACARGQFVCLAIEAHRIRELGPRWDALLLFQMAPHIPSIAPNRIALGSGFLRCVGAAYVVRFVRSVVPLVGCVFAITAR